MVVVDFRVLEQSRASLWRRSFISGRKRRKRRKREDEREMEPLGNRERKR